MIQHSGLSRTFQPRPRPAREHFVLIRGQKRKERTMPEMWGVACLAVAALLQEVFGIDIFARFRRR